MRFFFGSFLWIFPTKERIIRTFQIIRTCEYIKGKKKLILWTTLLSLERRFTIFINGSLSSTGMTYCPSQWALDQKITKEWHPRILICMWMTSPLPKNWQIICTNWTRMIPYTTSTSSGREQGSSSTRDSSVGSAPCSTPMTKSLTEARDPSWMPGGRVLTSASRSHGEVFLPLHFFLQQESREKNPTNSDNAILTRLYICRVFSHTRCVSIFHLSDGIITYNVRNHCSFHSSFNFIV